MALRGHSKVFSKLLNPFLIFTHYLINEVTKNIICIHGSLIENWKSIHTFGLEAIGKGYIHFINQNPIINEKNN